ncbi:hypothetical protein, variant [Cladophialophora immunda]|uniref:C2H2-type domain-containing protein n=1 Tax=Cladophialophora immunda TaxID=569365 RepID=A0A0D2CW84_9EURO|nr:hypothetical protein, variant [Cladophialophora immunda]KIW34115.1 hypothetical protein, variant [Cladophialophora immunda]
MDHIGRPVMSYHLHTGFGGSYNSQEENINNSYSSGGHESANNRYPTHASYPRDIRQPHASASGYDWAVQHQQNFPNSADQRTAYNTNAWDDRRTQITPDDDRTRQGQHATQAAAGGGGSGHAYYNPTPSNLAGQNNNSRLNNLAYVSGLDDTALQRHEHHQQHSSTASTVNHPSTAVNRVRSPATTHSTSRYENAQPSTYGYGSGLPSQNQQNPLLGALTAFDGAVNARFQQGSAAMGGHSSTSPVMENSSSRQQFSQRAASPYYQPQVTKTQAQGCRSSTTSQANYGRTTSAASTTQEKARQIANISQHRRGPSMESSHGNAQPQVQMVKSISNLLTLSAEEPPRSQHSAALEPQSMPNYIDPSQVFNPFHKEHERRRREIAAQAEAAMRRKAEEEVAAKRKAEVEAISTAENREQLTRAPAAVTATPNITKANKMANQTKQTKRTTSPVQKPSENEHQPDRQPNSMDGEADMAAGLKVMMEKMQEFRNKDPALFQKLWDDMRNTSSVPSVPLQSPSPQIRTQQALPTTQSRPRPNGYRVVVENNPEGLPDLGRFPAERRIRGTYNNKTSSETETATVKEAKSTGPIPISKQETITTPAEQRTSTPAVPSIKKTVLLSQGFPPPQSTGETMWPEDKRNTLAQVAVRFLKASPENKESEITTEDIHTILEQNPSYTDLCLMLEKKGLKFHRGQFARQLLSDVPQLRGPLKTPLPQAPPAPLASQAPVPAPALEISAASAQSAVMPPGPLPVNTPAPPPHIPASAPTPGAVPVIKFNTGFQAARQSPFRGHPPASLHGQMQRPKPTRNHHQPRAEPTPGSKEAMARKRDFSELVDLTALSDNEDYVMSKKQARVDSPSPEPTDLFQKHQDQPSHAHPPPLPVPYTGPGYPAPLRFDPRFPQQPQGYVPLPHYPPPHLPAPSVAPPPPPQPHRPIRILAKPINKQEALRKTYYDAKTVARDVLIAAGRHPTERPLNAHMAGLLGKYVEFDSDLSTFDWNAIDPGGPLAPQVPYADVPTEPPRFRLGEAGIRRRGQVPPPQSETVQKGLLPDQGKRRMSPPALAPVTATATATATATSTVGPPAPKVKTRPPQPPSPTSLSQVSTKLQSPRVSLRSQARETEKVIPKSTPKSVIPQKRRQSLISSNSSPVSDRRQSTRSASTQVPSTVESKTMSTGVFFSSGKRRGRPPGAKNLQPTVTTMKKAAVQELSSIEVTIPSPASPSLPVFKCRWRGCKAHLHNLKTLQNHISKVHRPTAEVLKEDGGYICWWKRCEYLVDDGEGSLRPSEIFDNLKDWLGHIEEHMKEVASKIGDGPTTKIIDPPP